MSTKRDTVQPNEVDTFRYERIEGASHWVQLDAPDRVKALLLDFLGSHDTSGAARRTRRL